MTAINSIISTLFDVLLAPFGEEKNWSAWIDIANKFLSHNATTKRNVPRAKPTIRLFDH